jgi:hypothetical protein
MDVVIGVDAHKRTHTLVAVDGRGRKLAEKNTATTSADPQAMKCKPPSVDFVGTSTAPGYNCAAGQFVRDRGPIRRPRTLSVEVSRQARQRGDRRPAWAGPFQVQTLSGTWTIGFALEL